MAKSLASIRTGGKILTAVAGTVVLASLFVSAGTAHGGAAASGGTSSALPVYAASFGYDGHAGLYGYGMGFDATDNTLPVGDIWNYRVQRFSTSGTFIKTVSKVAQRGVTGGIGAPFGVGSDPSGNVWVAPLGGRHRAGVEPRIDHRQDARRDLAARRTCERDPVDHRAVRVDVRDVRAGQLGKLRSRSHARDVS